MVTEDYSVDQERIDWANLSQEDKEVFFGWLDEFFAAYIKRLGDLSSAPDHKVPSPDASESIPSTPPASRPPLPARKSTGQVAPVLPSRTRPELVSHHHAESEPPSMAHTMTSKRFLPTPPKFSTGLAPPPINTSTKPSAPSFAPEPTYDSSTGSECIRCRDYTEIDAHASAFPRHTVSSIHQLSYDLTSPFSALIDKARAITFWLHLNITYDAHAFLTRNVKPSTPESTLSTGMAVCEGYAGLFAALALAAGMECIVINGHGKGFGYEPPPLGLPLPAYHSVHAWNAIRLESGEWKLVDSCWAGGALDASGVFNRRFDAFHFVATNEEFGRKHFPDPSEPWKQFVAEEEVLTWEEYIGTKEDLPQMTGSFGEGEYAAHLLWPKRRVIEPGATTFYLKRKCEHWVEREGEGYVPVMMGPKAAMVKSGGGAQSQMPISGIRIGFFGPVVKFGSGGGGGGSGGSGWMPMEEDATNGGWRVDGLEVMPGEKVMIALVKTVGGSDARGLGTRGYVSKMGREEITFEVLVQWEVQDYQPRHAP